MTAWRWPGLVPFLVACQAPARGPATVPTTLEPVASSVTLTAPAGSSLLLDQRYAHELDGSLAPPGTATLRGVSTSEAWIIGSAPQAYPYGIIVALDTGCVVETLARAPEELGVSGDDASVLAQLHAGDARQRLGAEAALAARFDHLEVGSVMTRGHVLGDVAVSDDRRKLAVLVGWDRVFLSLDGGTRFVRADAGGLGLAFSMRFTRDGRYLIITKRADVGDTQQVAILDTQARLPAPLVQVSLDHHRPLQVSTDDGKLLFAHTTDRCVYGVDPAKASVEKLACVAGPRIDKDHYFLVSASPSGRFGMELQGDGASTRGIVFGLGAGPSRRRVQGGDDLLGATVGPDDQGRYAWEARPDTLRIDGPDGVHDAKMGGTPLGFDLDGNVLVFVQPPLVRPDLPTTMMPPTKGTLDDVKCKLLRRVSPR